MRAYVVQHPEDAFTQVDPSPPCSLSTLLPLLTGLGQAHHGIILREAAALADGGKLRPLLNKQRFSSTGIDAAYALVESGALGKVVVDL
jgi:NADPH:quinone reductase